MGLSSRDGKVAASGVIDNMGVHRHRHSHSVDRGSNDELVAVAVGVVDVVATDFVIFVFYVDVR